MRSPASANPLPRPSSRASFQRPRRSGSGDLGEIYATEWIDVYSGYRAPIKRLRWKDHRNMAMRGDDVIAIQQDVQTQRLRFLKTEAKSRASLTAKVLAEARGRPGQGRRPPVGPCAFVHFGAPSRNGKSTARRRDR